MLIPSEIEKKFSQLAAQRQANKDAPANFTSEAPTPGHDAARAAADNQDHEHTSLCFGDDDDGEYPPDVEGQEVDDRQADTDLGKMRMDAQRGPGDNLPPRPAPMTAPLKFDAHLHPVPSRYMAEIASRRSSPLTDGHAAPSPGNR